MKRILVTGAGGYLGSLLVGELVEAGYEVVAYDRFFFGEKVLGPLARSSQVIVQRGDVRDIAPQDFEGVHAVCDLAALSNDPAGELDPVVTFNINHKGRARVARLAKEAKVARYVLSSSCSIYGLGAEEALDENAATAPLTTYATANLRAEEETLPLGDGNFVTTALRIATMYGLSPRMRFDLVVNTMTLHAVQKGRIFVSGGGQQWRPHIHVRDAARAFRMVIEAPPDAVNRQVFNLGAENARIMTVADTVHSVAPFPVAIEVGSDTPDLRDYNVSFEKIGRVLKFAPRFTMAEGIREICEALRRGEVADTPETTTVSWYRRLFEARRLLETAVLNGQVPASRAP
jgi:nucleoside-diphosphate-sugar epimerase